MLDQPPMEQFTKDLLQSMNVVLADDGKLKPAPPITPVPVAPRGSDLTLSEIIEKQAMEAKNAATPPAATPPPADPSTGIPNAAPNPPEQKLPDPSLPPKKPAVRVKEYQPPVPPAPTPTPAPPQPQMGTMVPTSQPQAQPDDLGIDLESLTDAQRDELEVARYAEQVSPEAYKGHTKKIVDYLKRVEQWAKDHPDASPDDPEFKEFKETNKPRWKPGDRRALGNAMIQDKAAAIAEQRLRAELDSTRREINAIKKTPVVDKQVSEFDSGLAKTASDVIEEDVLKDYATMSEDEFREAHQVEANILLPNRAAAREYIAMQEGIAEFNPQNPTHAWLNRFILANGQWFAQNATPAQKVRHGKHFLSPEEYYVLAPEQMNKFWTFDRADVLNMLKQNVKNQITVEQQRLERAGYVRAKKAKVENAPPQQQVQTPPPVPSGHVSPQASATPAPGAARQGQNVNPNASFLEALMPGASNIANL